MPVLILLLGLCAILPAVEGPLPGQGLVEDRPAEGPQGVAVGPLVEAEASGAGGTVAREGAIGQAATATSAWAPLLRMPPPPASLGPQVQLWIRHQGGPLQCKTLDVDGGQRERDWLWTQPKTWTWSAFAAVPAIEAVGGALVIRGREGEAPVIDQARWAAAAGSEAPTVLPAEPIAITVDWNQTIATASDWAYGMNCFRAYHGAFAADPRYQAGLARLAPGLLRWWSAEMDAPNRDQAWLDHDTRAWRRERIQDAVAARPIGMGEIMITIGHFPPWVDQDGDHLIDEDQIPVWAELCADLVRIVNLENAGGVQWWEITNERDDAYHNHLVRAGKPSRIDLLAKAYLAAAQAMKAVDPGIKTGGPAAIRPDLIDGLRLFVRATAEDLDFYSYHAYASGKASDADHYILGRRISAIRDAIRANGQLLREEIPDRHVPHLLNEYNISWTWETRDPRMTTHKGAVFDALVLAVAATAGADGTAAWNECDGIYGKLGGDFSERPQVDLFAVLNRHGRGRIVASQPSVLEESHPVVAYAVASETGRLLMLINRANIAAAIDTTALTFSDADQVLRIGDTGVTSPTWDEARQRLPAHSVTVVWR